MMEQKAQEALEASTHQQKEHYELALKLSKIVHDQCKDVPHDIGMVLADVVFNISQPEKEKREESDRDLFNMFAGYPNIIESVISRNNF